MYLDQNNSRLIWTIIRIIVAAKKPILAGEHQRRRATGIVKLLEAWDNFANLGSYTVIRCDRSKLCPQLAHMVAEGHIE